MATIFIVSAPLLLTYIIIPIVAALLFFGVFAVVLSIRSDKDQKRKLLATGIILMVAGGTVFFLADPLKQNSITVGTDSIAVSAPPYFNLNISADQISHAYVVNLSDWNISLSSRTAGTALGSFDAGYFKLSNGASADVLTTGQTNLILVLNSGTYVILGPNDFQSFLAAFDQSVMQTSSAT